MFTANVFGGILMLCIISNNYANEDFVNIPVRDRCASLFAVDYNTAMTEMMSVYQPIPQNVMQYMDCYMRGTYMMNSDGMMFPTEVFKMLFPPSTNKMFQISKDMNMMRMFRLALEKCDGIPGQSNSEIAGHMYRCVRKHMFGQCQN